MIGKCYLLTSEVRDTPRGWRRVRLEEPRLVLVLVRGSFRGGGPARNVLVEDVFTGERFVRPFRGLRVP